MNADRKFWQRPIFVLIFATTLVVLSYGSRQSFGMFLRPISLDLGWGRETLSVAIAMQALIYGLAAPFVGAIADKWGPIKMMVAAGVLYTLGLALMSQATTQGGMMLSIGFLTGLGSSGTALPLLLSVVSRVVSEDKRSLWLGIVTSGGTAGQFVIVPLTQAMIASWGWPGAALALAMLVALVIPLAGAISTASAGELDRKAAQSLGEAVREARGHSGFWLLVTGFFVCGLQVQFINIHLPAYLGDSPLGAMMGAFAIALIGLFNMLGTWIAGWLGGRYRKKYLLSGLYFARSLVILTFALLPVSYTSVVIFSALIGLLWLATVPLTSGIVAQLFGTRYLATLYGVVFLSHQLGSFTGVWLGGRIFDATGSYDAAWLVIVGAGLVASLLHWPINDRPVTRITAQKA